MLRPAARGDMLMPLRRSLVRPACTAGILPAPAATSYVKCLMRSHRTPWLEEYNAARVNGISNGRRLQIGGRRTWGCTATQMLRSQIVCPLLVMSAWKEKANACWLAGTS